MAVCQNIHVIDQADIRARIRRRLDDLSLSVTGTWLKDHGIGQTTIRNYLAEMSQSLTVETVSKLAEPLKTSERWLLFGDSQVVNEDALREMAEYAAGEIQPGLSIAQIRSAVSSALREQLALHLSVGEGQHLADGPNAPGVAAQSLSPTTGDGQAGSRNS